MKTSDLDAAIYTVRKRWPKARAIQSLVGGGYISLGLGDGRELVYRADNDLEQLWKAAAANVNKFDVPGPETKSTVVKKALSFDPNQWLTKDGTKMALTDMSDKHIANTIGMLERSIARTQSRIEGLKAEQQRRLDLAKEQAKQRTTVFSQAPGTRMFRDDE